MWMTRKHVLEAIVELMGPGLGALIRDGIQYRAVCALSFRVNLFFVMSYNRSISEKFEK